MRLLNIRTLQLESFATSKSAPPYAILSHVWGEDEVIFSDIQEQPYHKHYQDLLNRFEDLQLRFDNLQYRFDNPDRRHARKGKTLSQHQAYQSNEGKLKNKSEPSNARNRLAKLKKGWFKIEGCCREAARFGIEYIWIDNCCIDKDSSTELSEALNSMFNWYQDSKLCFAYLSDAIDIDDAFGIGDPDRYSRWFTRGWTLQELIAPHELLFYQKNWQLLGHRSIFANNIETITKIPHSTLLGSPEIESFSAARRLSWASERQTTRPEDRAYSLMGLFAINMPIIYGEGEQSALFRLQVEIFRMSGDHSIFAWASGGQKVRDAQKLAEREEQFSRKLKQHQSAGFKAIPSVYGQVTDIFASKLEYFSLRVEDSNQQGGVTDRHSNSRPLNIETRLYDWGLYLTNLTEVKPPAKYSAFSHGLRVQIPLQKAEDGGSIGDIFLAHLACQFENTKNVVGIYLNPTKDGQYQRVHPHELVSIEPDAQNASEITVEDIYIGNRKPNSEPVREFVQFEGINPLRAEQICLYHVILHDGGFKQSGFTVGGTEHNTVEGLDYAVLFRSEALTRFGMLIKGPARDYDSICRVWVGVVRKLPPDTTVTQLGGMKIEAEYSREISRRERSMIVAPVGSDRHVIVEFANGISASEMHEEEILERADKIAERKQMLAPQSEDPESRTLRSQREFERQLWYEERERERKYLKRIIRHPVRHRAEWKTVTISLWTPEPVEKVEL